MKKRQKLKMKRIEGNFMLMVDSIQYEGIVNPIIPSKNVFGKRVNTSLINLTTSMNTYLINVQKSKGPYAHPSNYRYWKQAHNKK